MVGVFDLDRALRWKMETLLELGFDLGRQGRTYRYLHHSQSQLKDKQFWFYHHEEKLNFSFEEAFAWMGDFQGERIVAKHSARIAQCFTSAEATIAVTTSIFSQSFLSSSQSRVRLDSFETSGIHRRYSYWRFEIQFHRWRWNNVHGHT